MDRPPFSNATTELLIEYYTPLYEKGIKKVKIESIKTTSCCLNNLIDYDWLNQSFDTFKIKCKERFLND